MIDVSIITVNYNGLNDTCYLIESLHRLTTSISFEIVVVDNASKVNEAQIVQGRFPMVKTIRSEENLGFAGGNNLGVKHAEGKYLFFINNDTYVLDSPFEPLIERLQSNASIGMICPKIRFSELPNLIQFAGYTTLTSVTLRNELIGFACPDSAQFNEAKSTPYAHGAAMFIGRTTLERVGMMREEYFLYYEELDWSVRIAEQGFLIYYEPQATVYHKESRSTGQDSPLKSYYLTRNRLYFAQYNMRTFQRILSQCYQIGVALPIHVAKYCLTHRAANARAELKAVGDFLKNKTGNSYGCTN